MPDVPWHIGFAKKEENDPRRHKARCIYYENKICKCRELMPYKGRRCPGSSHCDYYTENNEEQSKEAETERRADIIRQSYIKKKNQLLRDNSFRIPYRLHSGSKCPICNEALSGLRQKKSTIVHCVYCGAYFDSEKNREHKHKQIMIDAGLFFYSTEENDNGGKKFPKITVSVSCIYQLRGKCQNRYCESFGKRCQVDQCEKYEAMRI